MCKWLIVEPRFFQWAKVFEHGVSIWQSLFDVSDIFKVLFPDESKKHVRICS